MDDILVLSYYNNIYYRVNFFTNLVNLSYRHNFILSEELLPCLNKLYFDDIVLLTNSKIFIIDNKKKLLEKYLILENLIGKKVIIIKEDKNDIKKSIIISRVLQLLVFLNGEEIIKSNIYYDKSFITNYKTFIADETCYPSLIYFDKYSEYKELGKELLGNKFINVKKKYKFCNIL